jgi:hypothetical protein
VASQSDARYAGSAASHKTGPWEQEFKDHGAQAKQRACVKETQLAKPGLEYLYGKR